MPGNRIKREILSTSRKLQSILGQGKSRPRTTQIGILNNFTLKMALETNMAIAVRVSNSSEGIMQQSWRKNSIWFLCTAFKKRERKNQNFRKHLALHFSFLNLQQLCNRKEFTTAVSTSCRCPQDLEATCSYTLIMVLWFLLSVFHVITSRRVLGVQELVLQFRGLWIVLHTWFSKEKNYTFQGTLHFQFLFRGKDKNSNRGTSPLSFPSACPS